MRLWEVIKIIFIGVGNFFYVLFIDLIEVLHLWNTPLLCFIDLKLFFAFLFKPPYLIINREAPKFGLAPENFIYGETPLFTLKALLKEAEITSQDHFYDLGCGRGKAVLGANYFYDIPATGIELLKGLVHPADRLRLKLGFKKVGFIVGDFNEVDLSSGTIFLVNGTTWPQEVIDKTAQNLSNFEHPFKIISLSVPLPGFKVLKAKSFWFSWGRVKVFFQEKNKMQIL
jgi:hypothetical protein